MTADPGKLIGRTTRVRGWNPTAKSRALIDTVLAILAEYAAYLPLTIRQIFYRLVGAHDYEKTEHAYKRLGETINRARRARLIESAGLPYDLPRAQHDERAATLLPGYTLKPAQQRHQQRRKARNRRIAARRELLSTAINKAKQMEAEQLAEAIRRLKKAH